MRPKAVWLVVWCFTAMGFGSVRSEDEPKQAIDSKDNSVLFRRDVMPLVTSLGCNSIQCHGAFSGQGGMTLSLFAGDPEEDYEEFVKAELGGRINRMEPAKSLLLLKASATVSHKGGKKVPLDSPEYKTLLSWIEQGAPYWDDEAPALVAVEAAPDERVLEKGQTQQLAVTAAFSDGTEKDITRLASFLSTDDKVASVDAQGNIRAEGFGLCAIVATYLRKPAVVRIVIPQPIESSFPTVEPNNNIDELVLANLKMLGLPPSEVCSDEVFLRRVFLDVIGTLPTPEEARAFLADNDPQKRSKLIDRLLEREEFVTFLALKWSDLLRVKAEVPFRLWPKGAETYYQWIYESIAQNKPYDQFARELLTATGSDFRHGASNFFRAVQQRNGKSYGEAAALAFMGARLSCAGCHGHPVEDWDKEDGLGMAAFFCQMRFKFTNEWKEEVLYRDPEQVLLHPRTGKVVPLRPLDSEPLEVEPGADPRRVFAEWLTAPENPWFAKSISNRIWFWLLGRGIVHEPDDLRKTNPPENPALLEYLGKELVSNKFDLKHIYRLVLNSKIYQLSSDPHPLSANDFAHFSHYMAKRLTAEQLVDGVSQVAAVPPGSFGAYDRPTLAPITVMPADLRTMAVSDGSAQCVTASTLGRPTRTTGFESERAASIGLDLVGFLVKSEEVQKAISGSPRIKGLIEDEKSDGEIVEEIFLAALSRFPAETEKQKLTDYLAKKKSKRAEGVSNVMWAVLNTNEFLLNH